MGRFSPKNEFSPRPIFKVGEWLHKLGAWVMGYKWGTDLYCEGMKYGIESERDRACRESHNEEGQADE